MTTEQLKACVHCDGLPLQAADTGLDYDHDTIVCDDCGATAPTAEAWNRRPVEQLSTQTAVKPAIQCGNSHIPPYAKKVGPDTYAWQGHPSGELIGIVQSGINSKSSRPNDKTFADKTGTFADTSNCFIQTEQPSLSDAEITDEQICEVLLLVGVSPYGYPKSGDRFIRNDTKRIITAFRALLAQRQDSEQSRLMLADDTSPRIPQRQDSNKEKP